MESDDPRAIIKDGPDSRVMNQDADLGIYYRGDSIRIVNQDDGSSIDLPRSIVNALAVALISVTAPPMPRHEPERRVVHQPRRFVRSLSEGMPKG